MFPGCVMVTSQDGKAAGAGQRGPGAGGPAMGPMPRAMIGPMSRLMFPGRVCLQACWRGA